jgi:hypothetical protein
LFSIDPGATPANLLWTVVTYSDGTTDFKNSAGQCAVTEENLHDDGRPHDYLVPGACTSSGALTLAWPHLGMMRVRTALGCLAPKPLSNGSTLDDCANYPDGDVAYAPMAHLDYHGRCPYVAAAGNGTPVYMQTGTRSDCPWSMTYQSASKYTLTNGFGYCLDSSYGGTAPGTPLVEGACAAPASATQTWTTVPGTLPHSVRYQQVASQLCARPAADGVAPLVLGTCDWLADFGAMETGPLRHYNSAECVTASTSTANVVLTQGCFTGEATWKAELMSSGSGKWLQFRLMNGTGTNLCLSPTSGVTTAGTVVTADLCAPAGTVRTSWTPQPGVVPGTVQYVMAGQCLTIANGPTDTGPALVLGACGSPSAAFGDRAVTEGALRTGMAPPTSANSAWNAAVLGRPMCVTASGASVGASAMANDCQYPGGTPQPAAHWFRGLTGTAGVFELRNGDGYCLDSANGATTAGTALVVGTCGNKFGGTTFRTVASDMTGSERYQQVKSGLCVRIGGDGANTAVRLGACDDGTNARTDPTKVKVRLQNSATGGCVSTNNTWAACTDASTTLYVSYTGDGSSNVYVTDAAQTLCLANDGQDYGLKFGSCSDGARPFQLRLGGLAGTVQLTDSANANLVCVSMAPLTDPEYGFFPWSINYCTGSNTQFSVLSTDG